MNHVAGDDGIGTWFADLHRVVVDCVAGRWDQGNEIVESVGALHDVDAVSRDDRQHRVSNPGTCRGIVFATPRPMRKLAVGEYVARLREGRHPPAVLEPRVPADMVDMQMRAHDEIDFADADTGARQAPLKAIGIHHVPERAGGSWLVIANTGIDQDVVLWRL